MESKKKVLLGGYVHPSLVMEIDRLAKEEERSRTMMITILIKEALRHREVARLISTKQ